MKAGLFIVALLGIAGAILYFRNRKVTATAAPSIDLTGGLNNIGPQDAAPIQSNNAFAIRRARNLASEIIDNNGKPIIYY